MGKNINELQLDLRTSAATKGKIAELLSHSIIWHHDERPDSEGDACDLCGQPMPVNILTALFGVHKECWESER
jgi:hypothetical protein